jgi:ABC-type tungstate transport system permease subunit
VPQPFLSQYSVGVKKQNSNSKCLIPLFRPRKHGVARLAAAKIFADWLVSPEGQQAIGAYQVDGQQLFNPSAASPK